MAVGTTFSSIYRRDEIIAEALAILTKAGPGGYSMDQVERAVKALNKIIRAESIRNDSDVAHFWALSDSFVILEADVYNYTLASDVLNIKSMSFRDTNGIDTPMDLLTPVEWARQTDKFEQGDPLQAYFKQHTSLSSQVLYINPAPASVTAGEEVLGTDGLNYTCIRKHESATGNKPITGDSYSLFWTQTGSSGGTWATATDYSNGELLVYTYERPLYDFTSPTDNPDMPPGWENFLINALAYDLAPIYRLSIEERQDIKLRREEAYARLHPQKQRIQPTNLHNKAKFF
jgi:hypothetical protein